MKLCVRAWPTMPRSCWTARFSKQNRKAEAPGHRRRRIPTPIQGEDFKSSIQANGIYKCGFNFFMLNLTWSPTPGVPIQEARVDMIMNYYFKKPAALPSDLAMRAPNKELSLNPI